MFCRARSIVAVIGVLLTASACGNTAGERGVTGAGIGAGAGAFLGAVTGLSVVQGALIGAPAGGLVGGLTDMDTIDIGDPFWKNSDGAQQSESGTVLYVQQALADLSYDAGPADGVMGPNTVSSIRRYQGDHGLLVNGRVTPELATHMEAQVAQRGRQGGGG